MITLKHAVLALALAVSSLHVHGQTGYAVLTSYPVPEGGTRFDYATIDSAARRLYISHGDQVDVLDADSGKIIGTIPDTPGVHGIALAPEFKHGFTSNGHEDKVSMFDPETLKVIKKIDVGKTPDGIYYDPGTKRVFTHNHGSHDVTAIDAKTGEVVGTVKVDGDGEMAVVGRDGLMYMNNEHGPNVVVYDPKTLEVKNRFPVDAQTPTAMAYDPKTNRLFIGTRDAPMMVVMDAATGKVIKSYPIGAHVDYAAFDPQSKLIFFSCGDGTLSIYHEKSADDYEDAGAVKTVDGARTMAFDQKTKKIFLPNTKRAPSATPDKPEQPVPGTFNVLVVGKP